MIELKQVSKSYTGIKVLNNIDLKIADNSITTIMGRSGCGKTTLLKIIAGLLRIDSGTITIGNNIVDNSTTYIMPYKRNLGFVFQDACLWPHMTVKENIEFGIDDISKQEREERVLKLLKQVGLAKEINKYPYQLSGGQAKRVALARALAPRPTHLLLDEPLSNLDDLTKNEMLELIKSSINQNKQSVIYVTHDYSEAEQLGGIKYKLEKGCLTKNV